MTTPIRMVSVPVELAETPAIRNSLGLFRSDILCGEQWSDTCRDAYMAALKELDQLAMLTAAPVREEGGAVETAVKIATDLHHAYEQLIYGLPKYLEAENLTDEENMIREAWITLDVTAHRLAALATREEAPAEAGEGEAWKWIATLYPNDAPSDLAYDASEMVDAFMAGRSSALRAQPPAREDAQPVGWLRAVDEEMVCAHLGVADAEDSFETAKKKLASLIQWNIAVATDPSVGGHPAPDALRVAVEALERADRVIGWMSDYVGKMSPPADGLLELNQHWLFMQRDLSALQAEQGAK